MNSPNTPASGPAASRMPGSPSARQGGHSASDPGHPAPSDAAQRADLEAAHRASELPQDVRNALPGLDPAALEVFFDHYFSRIYAYIRRLVREEHLAEDLTQDVFLHVQKSLPNYDSERPLSPWVYTIATNKVRDLWRSRRHQEERYMQRIDADEGAPTLVSGAPQPSDALETSEVQDEVRSAVEELPEMLKTAFVLRFYEGMSFEAIGEMVDRNEAAVRKRYSRALSELREALSGLSSPGEPA